MTGLSMLLYSREEKHRCRYPCSFWSSFSIFFFFLPRSGFTAFIIEIEKIEIEMWGSGRVCKHAVMQMDSSMQPALGWGRCHQCWQSSRSICRVVLTWAGFLHVWFRSKPTNVRNLYFINSDCMYGCLSARTGIVLQCNQHWNPEILKPWKDSLEILTSVSGWYQYYV